MLVFFSSSSFRSLNKLLRNVVVMLNFSNVHFLQGILYSDVPACAGLIREIVSKEENSFWLTVRRGEKLLTEKIAGLQNVVPGALRLFFFFFFIVRWSQHLH